MYTETCLLKVIKRHYYYLYYTIMKEQNVKTSWNFKKVTGIDRDPMQKLILMLFVKLLEVNHSC